MGAVEFAGVSKWYGEVIAVNDVSFDLAPGVTGLLGPNGAGKSTMMRLMMGLARPSQGTVKVFGEDPWDNTDILSRIGFVPEGDAPWRDLPGSAVGSLAGRLAGMSRAKAEEATARALESVGLTRVADRKVETYSRGMRQRLKIALALMGDAQLLVLDEPLLGTDPPTRRDLIHLIRDLVGEGKTVLVSTHVLPDVEAMTQRILLMHHGRLMANGDVHEIRDLLERYPRTVRVATREPRVLGTQLLAWDSVLSVQADEGAVLVKTREPTRFFEQLQRLLASGTTPFTSITSPDDNVEAVFRYLVE
ncbi:MAG: ABC transporter ATP-binding protein [Thermoplasmatota archaeon]